MRTLTTALALLCLIAGFGCGTDSNSDTGEADPRNARDESAFSDKNARAVHNRISDARVMLYQPRASSGALIMVNNRHGGLAKRPSRLAIAQGNPRTGFKRISDLQMDALIQSLENRDGAVIRESYSRQHDRMLTAKHGQIPGFHGIIVVENDGQRWAYVGRRPQGRGDAVGAQKYKIFRDLKVVTSHFYNAEGVVEYVDQTGLGSSGSGFDR